MSNSTNLTLDEFIPEEFRRAFVFIAMPYAYVLICLCVGAFEVGYFYIGCYNLFLLLPAQLLMFFIPDTGFWNSPKFISVAFLSILGIFPFLVVNLNFTHLVCFIVNRACDGNLRLPTLRALFRKETERMKKYLAVLQILGIAGLVLLLVGNPVLEESREEAFLEIYFLFLIGITASLLYHRLKFSAIHGEASIMRTAFWFLVILFVLEAAMFTLIKMNEFAFSFLLMLFVIYLFGSLTLFFALHSFDIHKFYIVRHHYTDYRHQRLINSLPIRQLRVRTTNPLK